MIPDTKSEDMIALSCEEKPGGGNLLGAEKPGGAETWDLTAARRQWSQVFRYAEEKKQS